MQNNLKEKLIEKSNYDIEAQEEFLYNEIERQERHKDDLACIALMLIFIFIHTLLQVFQN